MSVAGNFCFLWYPFAVKQGRGKNNFYWKILMLWIFAPEFVKKDEENIKIT
jgi:hypothetical protein